MAELLWMNYQIIVLPFLSSDLSEQKICDWDEVNPRSPLKPIRADSKQSRFELTPWVNLIFSILDFNHNFSPSSFAQCDGVPLNLSEGPPLQGITFLNIPSTHGGTNMWGDSKVGGVN